MRTPMPPHKPHGFTLIELLIALTLMAVLAVLGWRGIDGMVRTRDIAQLQTDRMARLQTVLAQWRADLDAQQAMPGLSDGLLWDGQLMRIVRRSSALRNDGSEVGLWVVGWTVRDGQWLRWQSPALTTRDALDQAWQQASRWAQSPDAQDRGLETTLLPIDSWQLTYFRGNAWTNPLSSAGNTGTTGTSSNASSTATTNTVPDAIRLFIDLPAATGAPGRLTVDWVRPNFYNTKS